MKVKWLREQLGQLNDEADVTVTINGVLFELPSIWTDVQDDPRHPRVVLGLGRAYQYRAQP
jgi:hypothetical protein